MLKNLALIFLALVYASVCFAEICHCPNVNGLRVQVPTKFKRKFCMMGECWYEYSTANYREIGLWEVEYVIGRGENEFLTSPEVLPNVKLKFDEPLPRAGALLCKGYSGRGLVKAYMKRNTSKCSLKDSVSVECND